jgi:hypothetical protein
MDLDTACQHIHTTVERMRAAYLKPVFDEWAILTVPVKSGGVVAYRGPRAGVFRRNLATDAEPLRKITVGKQFTEGDIEFVPDAADTCYDAFMKVGPNSVSGAQSHREDDRRRSRPMRSWLGRSGGAV